MSALGTAEHWLTVAREDCECAVFAPENYNCAHQAEHQRTAKILQAQVEPLKAEIARIHAMFSSCAECGPMVKLDEDGCCAQCGADAIPPDAAALHARGPDDAD